MIQVDLFWVYAIGAMFAFSAFNQVKKDEGKWYESKYFLFTILYLSVFFVTTASWLLWEFPHWESMHVFSSRNDVLTVVAVFAAATNILMGILGYYVTYYLIKKSKYQWAVLQTIIGYFIMFFILSYGWDGTGAQRFFWDVNQKGGFFQVNQFVDIIGFTYSSVAITLYIMGFIVLPPMIYFPLKWLFKGYQENDAIRDKAPKNKLGVLAIVLFGILGMGLVGAVLASFICWGFLALTGNAIVGMIIGLPIFLIPVYFLLLRKDMPLYNLMKKIYIEEP